MSLNFSAEQYEGSYIPEHLGQWQVPKKFREFPRKREGYTSAVTNERGHFLEDSNKPRFKEWSSFQGTWGKDYPRPRVVKCPNMKPGMWIVKGRRARWIEAVKTN